jgi:cell division protein FtsW
MRLSRTDRSLIARWWFTVDRPLLAALLILIGAGVMLSLVASPAIALKRGAEAFYFVKRHIVFAGLGCLIMFACSLLTPAGVRRASLGLLLAALVVMVLVSFLGPQINGAQRWIVYGGLQLQPSELLKPAFAVVVAWAFAEQTKRAEMPALWIAAALYIFSATLLVIQPDIGQTVLLTVLWIVLFFLSGRSLVALSALIVAAGVAVASAYVMLPHVKSRLDRFVDPSAGDTFQSDRARQSFIEGGWFGRGPGEGTVKTTLPDAHTDYILAVIAEEYGVIACLLLLGLYGWIVFRALSLMWTEKDPFKRHAIASLSMLIGVQALINMGVNSGLLPAKGMTLPFISYGGSSLIGMSIGMGFLLALTRRVPGEDNPRSIIVVSSRDELRAQEESMSGAKRPAAGGST